MKKSKFIFLALAALAFLALSVAALAGEVPGITPAEFATPASPTAHWFWSLLASDAASNLLLWVVTTITGAVLGLLKWEGTRKGQAYEVMMAAVWETYEEYVRQIKRANDDGKLTDDERRAACNRAIERGKQIAKEQGFDLLKVLAKESLPALVDSIVRKMKGEAAASKNPLPASLPPLPDLAP